MSDKNLYDKRIVAFLDILGWRSLISESASNPSQVGLLSGTLRVISNHYQLFIHARDIPDLGPSTKFLQREQEGWPRDFQFAQFSDSIILSAKATRLTPAVFLDDLMRFCSQLFYGGVLLRGGITIGDMFHLDAFGFGPALTRAYDLESQVARFPRIIIDPDHLSDILGSPWTRDHRKRRRPISRTPLIKKDRDGHHFVNFLTGAHLIAQRSSIEIDLPRHPDVADPRRYIFAQARLVIEGGLKRFAHQPQTLEKYEWLAKYYNDCASDYPNFPVERIVMQ